MSSDEQESQSRAARIEELLQQVNDIQDTQLREQMEELIQSLVSLYGDSLARILELTERTPAGRELIADFAGDALIGPMLLLYELHPDDLQTRVVHAVNEVRPYVASQGGNLELIGIVDGVAHLRVDGTCQSCSSPTSTIRPMIEQAIYDAAPDLASINIEDATAPSPKLITLAPTRRKSTTQTSLREGSRV